METDTVILATLQKPSVSFCFFASPDTELYFFKYMDHGKEKRLYIRPEDFVTDGIEFGSGPPSPFASDSCFLSARQLDKQGMPEIILVWNHYMYGGAMMAAWEWSLTGIQIWNLDKKKLMFCTYIDYRGESSFSEYVQQPAADSSSTENDSTESSPGRTILTTNSKSATTYSWEILPNSNLVLKNTVHEQSYTIVDSEENDRTPPRDQNSNFDDHSGTYVIQNGVYVKSTESPK